MRRRAVDVTISNRTGVDTKGNGAGIDERVRRAVVIGFTWVVGTAGIVWGIMYILVGAPGVARYPFGFAALSVLNGLLHRKIHSFTLFASVQIALILAIPFLLDMDLGGITSSGGVVLWSALAPVGTAMIFGPRPAMGVFGAFVVLSAIAALAPTAWPQREILSPPTIAGFLFMNIVGVSLVVLWTVRTFVVTNRELQRRQQKLRELEQAYLAQDLVLRRQERLATLGQLSAGVAHELNNPAAAAGRASGQLATVLKRIVDGTFAMITAGVSAGEVSRIRELARPDADRDPLERSDREDDLARWLTDRGAEDPWELACVLAGMGMDADALDSVDARSGGERMDAALRWIADTERARGLVDEVHESAGRISQIVAALKGYSHMDRSTDGPVDLRAGIESTLVILRGKLAGIDVRQDFQADLPPVRGNTGELNQVWTNLLANAAEALGDRNRRVIEISARREGKGVTVEIADNGPGIPGDLIDEIFDPFVTTKQPGEGTGLGLHLVHQIVVDRHGGRIDVESEPGRTRFVIALPFGPEGRDD